MTTHYLGFNPEQSGMSGGEVAYLFSRVVDVVHRFNAGRADTDRVALDFPELVVGKSLGDKVRVFGTEAALWSFLEARDLRLIVQPGALECSQIRPVPAGHGWRRYRRSRLPEKSGPAWIARTEDRMLRKAAAAGRTVTEEEVVSRRTRIAAAHSSDPAASFISVGSRSTGKRFSMFFEAEMVDGGGAVPTTYGFSTVPSF